MKTRGTAVVLCVGINALGAVRTLSRKGVRVVAVYFDAHSPVRFSAAPDRKILMSSRPDDEALLALLAPYGKEQAVVLASSDAHKDFLSRCRDQLLALGLRLAVPAHGVAEVLNDKARELELMMTLPVRLPRSLIHLPADADEMLQSLSLPIIIKPRSYKFHHLIPTKNVVATTREGVERFVRDFRDVLDGFIAQEIVTGPDDALWVCNCCFNERADMVSAFTFQRIRMAPPHFGVTTFAVGRHNAVIKQQCATLGKTLNYSGPAMFEFKYDATCHEYCYIETNPRIGMCNALDVASGVDNVYAAYLVARGERPESVDCAQDDGVYFINVYSDLYSRYRDGEPLFQVLRSYWTTRPARIVWAYFDARDPLPFVQATWQMGLEIASAVFNKAVGVLRRR